MEAVKATVSFSFISAGCFFRIKGFNVNSLQVHLQIVSAMDKVQILLIVNSFLLAILSILFLVIGYFLKDLHKDFKTMVERVNTLYTEHNTHVVVSKAFDQDMNNRVSNLYRKVKKLQKRGADHTTTHDTPCS